MSILSYFEGGTPPPPLEIRRDRYAVPAGFLLTFIHGLPQDFMSDDLNSFHPEKKKE